MALFLLLLPLALKIDFAQNDDWVYYNMVQAFMRRNFTLDPISAPTFYLQGFLGAGFALIFGLQRLPVLTLLVSVVNLFVFVLLAKKITKDTLLSILLGLLLFFNPLYIYSTWSFMTEQYFLLFTTLALFFIYDYTTAPSSKSFALANVFILLAFFIRQLAFVTSLAFGMYLLLKKKWKEGLTQLGLFTALFMFYTFIFPKTAEMFEKPLEFKHLLEFSYAYSLTYAILLYICAFTFPVILFVLKIPSKKRLVPIFAGLAIMAFILLNKYFDPHKLAWGEFYYLDNVLERKGFFPRGIDGTKYFFKGMYDLYRHWDTIAKVFAAFLVTYLVVRPKKLVNIFAVFIVTYISVMLVTQKVYDRYLLVLVELAILFMVSGVKKVPTLKELILVPFILFLAFYSYQFSMDFILLNSYVWNKGEEISSTLNIDRRDIMGTNSWKLLNQNPLHNYKYIFTFDSYVTKPELKCCWTLVETKDIIFPYSLFINPKIYLYGSNILY